MEVVWRLRIVIGGSGGDPPSPRSLPLPLPSSGGAADIVAGNSYWLLRFISIGGMGVAAAWIG